MSIARAFTTKRAKREFNDVPQRSLTTKQSAGGIRAKISSPVELLSTTNMLSYNAPDLYPATSPASSKSRSSSEASDLDIKSVSSASTPPSSPDAENEGPEPNHLSCYFNGQSNSGLSSAKSTPNLKDESAPMIPTRAPSHTKRSHGSFSAATHKKSESRSLSLNRKASAPAIGHISSPSIPRSSIEMFNVVQQKPVIEKQEAPEPSTPITEPTVTMRPTSSSPKARPRPIIQGLPSRPNQPVLPMLSQPRQRSVSNAKPRPPPVIDDAQNYALHPFGNELAQVNELAEEFSGGKVNFADEESALMAEKGLRKFAAEDYMCEIQGLFLKAFGEIKKKTLAPDVWI